MQLRNRARVSSGMTEGWSTNPPGRGGGGRGGGVCAKVRNAARPPLMPPAALWRHYGGTAWRHGGIGGTVAAISGGMAA